MGILQLLSQEFVVLRRNVFYVRLERAGKLK
jgi:hypothetical protein